MHGTVWAVFARNACSWASSRCSSPTDIQLHPGVRFALPTNLKSTFMKVYACRFLTLPTVYSCTRSWNWQNCEPLTSNRPTLILSASRGLGKPVNSPLAPQSPGRTAMSNLPSQSCTCSWNLIKETHPVSLDSVNASQSGAKLTRARPRLIHVPTIERRTQTSDSVQSCLMRMLLFSDTCWIPTGIGCQSVYHYGVETYCVTPICIWGVVVVE